MFHRRLLLLMLAAIAPTVVLAGRLAQLTVLEHDRLRAEADAKLVRRSWTPAARGRILDRRGRVLARDQASFRVSILYSVLAEEWAASNARTYARRADGVDYAALDSEQREQLIAAAEDALRAHTAAMWDRLALPTGQSADRLRERGETIVQRVERMHDRVESSRTEREIDRRRARGERLDERELEAIESRAGQPIAEQRRRHVIATTVDDSAGFDLLVSSRRRVSLRVDGPTGPAFLVDVPLLPGVEIEDGARRVYPFDVVSVEIDRATLPGPLKGDGTEPREVRSPAWHLVGTIRDTVYKEDSDARAEALEADEWIRSRALTASGTDRGAYFTRDRVGSTGIEASREHELRGLRGLVRERLDTGKIERTEPAAGLDVRLAIDVMLQARVSAILDPALGLTQVQDWHGGNPLPTGTPLAAAVAVVEVETADVLALVSTPRPIRGDEPEAGEFPEYIDPFVNRAIAKPYPPGSIAKAVIAAEARRLGVFAHGEGIRCTGYLIDGYPDRYRCWIFKRFPGLTHSQHGELLGISDGLKYSCNIVFYTLGERLGRDGIRTAYERVGVGEPFEFGIGPEWSGSIGRNRDRLSVGETRLMGIGQGPVDWTPLHAANAYATIARGGAFKQPTLTLDQIRPDAEPLGIDAVTLAEIADGLRRAASEDGGTGQSISFGTGPREPIFNAPGVRVWGKTGTATAPALLDDAGEVVRTGDHAWYVCVAQPEGTDLIGGGAGYAIAVIVEYGGSGGRVSGPIANQVVHALVAEGYLPRNASTRVGIAD